MGFGTSKSGTAVHSLAVPNASALVGFLWDMQSVDLDVVSGTLNFADNELLLGIPSTTQPDMVPIGAGTFQMGSTQGLTNELPVHTVNLTHQFWMGRYEVTQAEYQSVMGANPSYVLGANRPVERVTWFDAMAYCAALTVMETTAGRVPSGYQYRLPTEAEWEYCCRAGTNTEWNFGTSVSCAQANFLGCLGTSSVVGNYAQNAWGVFDMHGNVFEWMLDSCGIGPGGYSPGVAVDPYVSTGALRVERGGGFDSVGMFTRSAVRSGYDPYSYSDSGGFRVVLAPSLVP